MGKVLADLSTVSHDDPVQCGDADIDGDIVPVYAGAARPKIPIGENANPLPPTGSVMVGAGSPSRLGTTHNNPPT
jgi:hypothetical protein